jgi:hypothetical protein
MWRNYFACKTWGETIEIGDWGKVVTEETWSRCYLVFTTCIANSIHNREINNTFI